MPAAPEEPVVAVGIENIKRSEIHAAEIPGKAKGAKVFAGGNGDDVIECAFRTGGLGENRDIVTTLDQGVGQVVNLIAHADFAGAGEIKGCNGNFHGAAFASTGCGFLAVVPRFCCEVER